MRYVFSTSGVKRYRFPTHINDLVMDRSEARNSEVFVVVVAAGKAAPLHKHDDTEQVFHVTQGRGALVVGRKGREFPVAVGDVVRIPPGTWHTIRCQGRRTLKYLAIDCFGGQRAHDEPTWDAHVRVLCRQQGWDYHRVRAAAR
jgi:mannose-6-phosphate isomerase-like protein (cupin superfamily)